MPKLLSAERDVDIFLNIASITIFLHVDAALVIWYENESLRRRRILSASHYNRVGRGCRRGLRRSWAHLLFTGGYLFIAVFDGRD